MFSAFTALLFVIGLIIGSFLNVVIYRMDDLKSILYTRSRCPSCRKEIAWYDLVPFLSFILLGAKCRFCKEKISWQYPIVELSTGVVFALLFLMFGLSWALLFYLIVFSLLVVIFVYDLKTQTIPEIFSWIALVLVAFFGWYFGGFSLVSAIAGGLIPAVFLGSLVIFSKEKWMGSGDIKIGAILGFLLGYPNALFGLFLAFILGSVVGLIYIYSQNHRIDKEGLRQSLPFAPFLIFSALFTLFYGNVVVSWYLGMFH